MSSTPLVLPSKIPTIPVNVLPSDHIGPSEKIALIASLATLALVVVNIIQVKLGERANKKNQQLSIVSMKHESLLSVFSILIAGMRGSLYLVEKRIKETRISPIPNGTDAQGNARYFVSLQVPAEQNFFNYEAANAVIQQFRSLEIKARLDLLESDEIGISIVRWIKDFDSLKDYWQEAYSDLAPVIKAQETYSNEANSSALNDKREIALSKLQILNDDMRKILAKMRDTLDGI